MKRFEWGLADEGITLQLVEFPIIGLFGNRKVLPVREWVSGGDEDIRRGLLAITSLLQNMDDTALDSNSVLLPHAVVASLSDAQARSLSLPPTLQYDVRIESEGSLADIAQYDLTSELMDGMTRVYVDERIGSIVCIGESQQRIPSPAYEIIEIVSAFEGERDAKLDSLGRIGQLLNADTGTEAHLDIERTLANMRIKHVAAFSASVKGDNSDNPILAPVLFSSQSREASEESGNCLHESDQLLTAGQAGHFNNEYLSTSSTPTTYLLPSSEYVFIDPSIREAMSSFRKICNASPDKKRAFLKSPRAMLVEMSDSPDEMEHTIDTVFVETLQFSNRVTRVGELEQVSLPFYAEDSNEWGFDCIVVTQEGVEGAITIPKDDIPDVLNQLRAAVKARDAEIDLYGRKVEPTQELIDAIKKHLREEPPESCPGLGPGSIPPWRNTTQYGANSIDNYIESAYKCNGIYRNPKLPQTTTSLLREGISLKGYQDEGVAWMTRCYNEGLPGLLLADDMGLGKTLQALAFMGSYAETSRPDKHLPMLVVAPTGLISNWICEMTKFLKDGVLGKVIQIHGHHVRKYKSVRGRDIDENTAMLDKDAISQAGVVMTTYETYRNYNISFSAVEFGMVILDEIQKVKNPISLNTRCIRGINSQFTIGLSGTPVENSMGDIWSIMDVIHPGLIGQSLKEFMAYFRDEDEERLAHKSKYLHNLLVHTDDCGIHPRSILRRTKDILNKDAAHSLPSKTYHPHEGASRFMPPIQADIYQEHLSIEPRIKALLFLRRISTTPSTLDEAAEQGDRLIKDSAKIRETFRILDKIKAKDEKAIIFLEARDYQEPLSLLIKERYSLPESPLIINGKVGGDERRRRIERFRKTGDGFGILILSPKSGGVGLNITCANHVIHLDRWWNPALEDQCNDRVYRIGQKKAVHIYTPMSVHKLLPDTSFDVVLDILLKKKRKSSHLFLMPATIGEIEMERLFGKKKDEGRPRRLDLEDTYALETGIEFEQHVSKLLADHDFKAKMTPDAGDGGADLVVHEGGHKVLIQCKQVQSKNGKLAQRGVDDMVRARQCYGGASLLVLVTNSVIIPTTVQKSAEENEVLIADGFHIDKGGIGLANLIKKNLAA